MSKQLAISSAFASFAMAAMALAYTPSANRNVTGNMGEYAMQAGHQLPDLQDLHLLPD